MLVSNNYQTNFSAKNDPIRSAVRAIKRQASLATESGASFYQDSAEIPIKHKILGSVTLYIKRLDEAKVSIQLFFRDRFGKSTGNKASMVKEAVHVEEIMDSKLVAAIKIAIEKSKTKL